MQNNRHKRTMGLAGAWIALFIQTTAPAKEVTHAFATKSSYHTNLPSRNPGNTPAGNQSTDFRPAEDAEKVKRLNRSFKVNSSDQLSIDNRYGKVHINTWDKNEMTVNVVVIARASSQERAQEILDMIDVEEDRSDNQISFRTRINSKSHNNWNNWGKKSGYEINYTVSMPRRNPLQVKNMYGDVFLADFSGKADLNVRYGSLKTERLNGDSNVQVAYGSGDMLGMKQGKLEVSYSKLSLESTQNLELKNSYSEVKIGDARTLNVVSKYGSVKISSVGNIQGTAGYTEIGVGELVGKMDMQVQYCNPFTVRKISPQFTSVNLEGGYSTFDLSFGSNAGFVFDVDLQYSDLHVDKDLVQYKVVEKRNTSSYYQGKFGKSLSGGTVNIRNRYGSVKFQRD